jgi:hypothetical protein
MPRIVFLIFAAALLAACGTSPNTETPAQPTENNAAEKTQTPTENRTERSTGGIDPARTPTSTNPSVSLPPVTVYIDDKPVSLQLFERTKTGMFYGENNGSIRMAEYGSDKAILIGFRNMDVSSPQGTYKTMSGQRSTEPQVVLNLVNLQEHAGKHITLRDGVVTVHTFDTTTGEVHLDFDGTAYALSDKTNHNPYHIKGEIKLTMPQVERTSK